MDQLVDRNKPPALTHIQFLVLDSLIAGERSAKQIREHLSGPIYESSQPAFYQVLKTLCGERSLQNGRSSLVKKHHSRVKVRNYWVTESIYALTPTGWDAWHRTISFYAKKLIPFLHNDAFIVKESSIIPGELGLFSTRLFERGALMGRCIGALMQDSEETEHGSDYCIDLGSNRALEPTDMFRFLNHCCEPNAEIIIFEEKDGPEVCIKSLRRIQIGEEIHIDYAWKAEDAFPATRCQCKRPSCRKYIVAKDEVSLFRRMLETRNLTHQPNQS